jgi:hypothetical protein
MNPLTHALSRRHFLRGAGVALGLPWLESFTALGESVAGINGVGRSPDAPRRLAAVFMGNGVNPQHWGADAADSGMVLKNSLRPLEPLRNKLLVFKGLWNPTTIEGPGGHFPKMNVLAGLKVKQTTTDVQVGVTMDQIVSREIGRATPVQSLVIGTEGPGYSTDSGYTSLYSAYISWASATMPAPKEIYPQQAFDQLFDDGSKRRRDKSIMDLVSADARGLSKHLSRRDNLKMQEYLNSIDELEKRIQRADAFSQKETAGTGWQPTVKEPTFPRPASGIPANPGEHMSIMLDILVLAFQMDRTRVVSLMLNNDLSGMNFGYLGDIRGGLHELSHHANDATRLAMYQKANEYHMQLWSAALAKMDATNEGERTLLDNSMVLFLSSLMDGNAHDSKQLPVLLAGGGGGSIKGGRLLDYSNDPNRKLCRLHMALMDRMGVKMNRFGDADTALSDLS